MNNKRTIHIRIEPTGEIQIEAVGFQGADCERATAFLEEALGITVNKERRPEYHQSVRTMAQQKIGDELQ